MIVPTRKSHLRSLPTAFSHVKFIPFSNTRPPHLGHLPSGSLPVKSTGCAEPPVPSPSLGSLPKSNSSLCSALSRISAAKGLPWRLRKPCSGPSCFSRMSVSTSDGSMNRRDKNVGRLKSHFSHWNRRYFSLVNPPPRGHAVLKSPESPGT